LKIRADSRVNEQFQNEVEKECAEHSPCVTAISSKNVRASEDHGADHLQLKTKRHARRFDGLDAGHVNQSGQPQKKSASEKGALQDAAWLQPYQPAGLFGVAQGQPAARRFGKRFPNAGGHKRDQKNPAGEKLAWRMVNLGLHGNIATEVR